MKFLQLCLAPMDPTYPWTFTMARGRKAPSFPPMGLGLVQIHRFRSGGGFGLPKAHGLTKAEGWFSQSKQEVPFLLSM